jgi:Fe2+ transport system protein FeoA
MGDLHLEANARYLIVEIRGGHSFRSFLLSHNISIGSVIQVNYSPRFSQLVNFTIRQKILSVRQEDFKNLECIKIS